MATPAAPAEGPTLASLVKRKLDTAAAGAQHRGRWVHHTGEDTIDETLEVYYCAYCGAHSLILDQLVSELPRRTSDQARVVAVAKHHTRLLLDEGPCVKIKRTPSLVEKQYRYLCKGCGLPLAYVSHPFADKTSNKYIYLIDGAFSLTNEGKTEDQLEAEQLEAQRAPIVIPVFQVQRTPAPTASADTVSDTAAEAADSKPAAASQSATPTPPPATAPADSSEAATAGSASTA